MFTSVSVSVSIQVVTVVDLLKRRAYLLNQRLLLCFGTLKAIMAMQHLWLGGV